MVSINQSINFIILVTHIKNAQPCFMTYEYCGCESVGEERTEKVKVKCDIKNYNEI